MTDDQLSELVTRLRTPPVSAVKPSKSKPANVQELVEAYKKRMHL